MAHVTVPDVAPRAQFAVGSSSTGPFNFTFTFYDNADLKVYVGDNTTPLTLTTNYTVVGTPGTTGGYVGGALTLVTAVANTTVTVELDIPILRTTDFPTVGAFNITSLNTQLDKMFSILAQLDQKYSRALHLPPVDGDLGMAIVPDADRDNTIFVWDADSEPAVKTYAEMAVLIGSTTAADNASGLAAKVAAELAETHAETAETNAEASEAAAAASAAAAAASFVAAGFPAPATASTMLVRNVGNTAYEAKTYAQTRTLLGSTTVGDAVFIAASASAARTAIGTVIGTDVQAYDADLAQIAALTSAADKLPYSTGAQAWTLATFTAAGRDLIDDATAAAQRTTLGSTTVGDALFIASSAVIARQTVALPMDSVSGLIVSRTGNDTWAVSAGYCRDTTDTYNIVFAAALTAKTLSGAWAAGSSTGGRTGAAEAASTAYHVFGIYNPSTPVSDVIIGSSYTSPTLPSGYTHYRYLGTLYNDSSSNLITQVHSGDYIHIDYPLQVVSDSTLDATVWETATLPVPPHAICMLQFRTNDTGAKADWRTGLKRGGASGTSTVNWWSNTQQIPTITNAIAFEPGGKGLVQVSSTSTIEYGVQTEATVASIDINLMGYFMPTRRNPAL